MENTVDVCLEVLKWAINESGFPEETAILRYPRLHDWIFGGKKPTFSQLQELSNILKIPFGMLFLNTPPNLSSFQTEFRTINQRIHNTFSRELKTVSNRQLIFRVSADKNAMFISIKDLAFGVYSYRVFQKDKENNKIVESDYFDFCLEKPNYGGKRTVYR